MCHVRKSQPGDNFVLQPTLNTPVSLQRASPCGGSLPAWASDSSALNGGSEHSAYLSFTELSEDKVRSHFKHVRVPHGAKRPWHSKHLGSALPPGSRAGLLAWPLSSYMGHKPELWSVECVWAEHLAHETLPQSFPLSQQRPVGDLWGHRRGRATDRRSPGPWPDIWGAAPLARPTLV